MLPFELPGVEEPLLRVARFLGGFAVVILIGWGVLEPAITRLISARNRNNPTLEEAISRYVRAIVVVGASIAGFSAAGFTTVVADSTIVIAAVTVALGIAGQSVIGSLVSGTALVVDPEFNVGNYIRWADGEGEVTSITLRVTRVRTLDGGLVTIPNTTLTDESIERPFVGDTARIVQTVEIAYGSDIERALDVLMAIPAEIDGIRADPSPRVGVEELGEDGVELRVEYWIDDPIPNQLPVRTQFARLVTDRLEEAAIDVSPAAKRDLEGQIRVEGGD